MGIDRSVSSISRAKETARRYVQMDSWIVCIAVKISSSLCHTAVISIDWELSSLSPRLKPISALSSTALADASASSPTLPLTSTFSVSSCWRI